MSNEPIHVRFTDVGSGFRSEERHCSRCARRQTVRATWGDKGAPEQLRFTCECGEPVVVAIPHALIRAAMFTDVGFLRVRHEALLTPRRRPGR